MELAATAEIRRLTSRYRKALRAFHGSVMTITSNGAHPVMKQSANLRVMSLGSEIAGLKKEMLSKGIAIPKEIKRPGKKRPR